MTIIVADSKLRMMVADTLVSDAHTAIYHAAKVIRCDDGALAGASGDVDACLAFLEWAKAGYTGEGTFEDAHGVIMTPEGVVRVYGGSHRWETPMGGWAAIGHGAPYATAARAVGAGPKQQVEAAMKVSLFCGGKAQVFRLRK